MPNQSVLQLNDSVHVATCDNAISYIMWTLIIYIAIYVRYILHYYNMDDDIICVAMNNNPLS